MTKATNTACANMELGGCGLKWRGSSVKGIVFCPLHGAAPELLKALKEIRMHLEYNADDPKCQNSWKIADRAISHAEAPGDE